MIPAIAIVLIVLTGLSAIQAARRRGIWSGKRFLVAVSAAVAIGVLASLPFYLMSPSELQAHEGLAIAGILTVIVVGVVALTVYARRWTTRQ